MNWQEQLKKLENNKQWDEAIILMQDVINNNSHNVDAYIAINFLLMNLLVEGDYDNNKHDMYAKKIKQYFDTSYAQFSQNADYLFCTGITAIMSEWYFDINHKEGHTCFKKQCV